jgi:hypothetical protein
MADGRYFLAKIIELFENDATLQALSSNGVRIGLAQFEPVGNEYPQVTVFLDEGNSEAIFPAGHFVLYVGVWVEKSSQTPFSMVRGIIKRVNQLINRKASSLSEIDVGQNEGLRVAQCLKEGGLIDCDRQTGLYYDEVRYGCVISEDESFDPNDSGDKPWI